MLLIGGDKVHIVEMGSWPVETTIVCVFLADARFLQVWTGNGQERNSVPRIDSSGGT